MLIQCPQLTPIQARLAATLFTLGTLALVYWALAHTQTAYAAQVNEHDYAAASRAGADHDWQHMLLEDTPEAEETVDHGRLGEGIHQGAHVPRANVLTVDANDSPNRGNLTAEETHLWRYTQRLLQSPSANQGPALPGSQRNAMRSDEFSRSELRKRETDDVDIEKRQATLKTIYVSINVCSQPTWNGTEEQQDGPPQLVLFVGKSGNQNPGPASNSEAQWTLGLYEGLVQFPVNVSSDVYMAVTAPTLPSTWKGNWTYDIAVSIDDYYHGADMTVPFMYLVDTDGTSALLVTENLTLANANESIYQQWMDLATPPFTMFADSDVRRRLGLSQSYCGLDNVARISQRNSTDPGPFISRHMITRGIENKPKQQFFVGNLSASTTYNATLALIGNGVRSGKGVVGGGGSVWQPTSWTTKTEGNCQLMYDMRFCSDVAYAVPSNQKNTTSELRSMYDNYAESLYRNFSYSLQQIQCNTSNDQKYSLARNCNDCDKAYKQWLCAVTVPRCEDFSNPASFLQARNVGQAFLNNTMLSDEILLAQFKPMKGAPTLPGSPLIQTVNWSYSTNQSRNPTLIDNTIAPGPYKEVLPCEDICYNLVQSCPAALQFSCPLPGRGLEAGYAPRPSSKSVIQCNFPGAVYYIDDARQHLPSMIAIFTVAIMTMLFMHL